MAMTNIQSYMNMQYALPNTRKTKYIVAFVHSFAPHTSNRGRIAWWNIVNIHLYWNPIHMH